MQTMGCDAYFGSPHKWLLTPRLRLPLHPPRTGCPRCGRPSSQANGTTITTARSASCQIGSGNLSLPQGYEAAVDFHVRIGPERVERGSWASPAGCAKGCGPIAGGHDPLAAHAELLTADHGVEPRGFRAAS